MNIHLHDLRKSFAWLASGAFLLGPMAFAVGQLPEPERGLAPVMGRITIEGRPVHDAIICFDAPGGVHSGFCSVWSDGTYRLENVCLGDGIPPGPYLVHVYARSNGADIPKRFQQSNTSGVQVKVGDDWNEVDLDLR